MLKHISAVDARRRLGALLDDVSNADVEYVIERTGKPTAAVVPIQVYEQLIKGKRNAFDHVEELRRHLAQSATAEVLEEAIDDAMENVRKRRR